jgi:hypothetical protein
MFAKVDFAGFIALIIAMIALVAVIAAPIESVAATRSASHHHLRVNGPMYGWIESPPADILDQTLIESVPAAMQRGIVSVTGRSRCDEPMSSTQVCARKREGNR